MTGELTERGKLTSTTEIPVSFGKDYQRLICTHGRSRASRSTGKRESYFKKATLCEAQLSLTVAWCGDRGFQVKVTQQVTEHNHTLDQRVYENHPSNRWIDDPDVIDFVAELQAARAKNKLGMRYLRRRTGMSLLFAKFRLLYSSVSIVLGKQVTLRDVHNLVSKLKEIRRGATTVESRLECCFREFCSQTENTATVYVDDNKLAQTITFPTQQMRRVLF
ncbi:hypothetical protein PC129_g12684 [Phytophthora cactorum]|uniref:FAR1 domain-containing protein n=1 Tax=Phytophthora cactorum TaxID=29920 RepID=A0A329RR91_9STRA|nr:hypothetical protein Pcac1_g16685 [Phytophthora cactorum]KAG2813223.1 hypothetical protein PC111_g14488 [Phytophthora cactorum]KAG2895033.1 hypothetical protein PC114_g15643 [Phytophthora cactorum]KAG2928974.1 hypothetical protein PC117_g14152 [Phytophthora cactorum]KAG2974498.1 hypothetical protein PC118_g14482 [Phytophthora cactorum]